MGKVLAWGWLILLFGTIVILIPVYVCHWGTLLEHLKTLGYIIIGLFAFLLTVYSIGVCTGTEGTNL